MPSNVSMRCRRRRSPSSWSVRATASMLPPRHTPHSTMSPAMAWRETCRTASTSAAIRSGLVIVNGATSRQTAATDGSKSDGSRRGRSVERRKRGMRIMNHAKPERRGSAPGELSHTGAASRNPDGGPLRRAVRGQTAQSAQASFNCSPGPATTRACGPPIARRERGRRPKETSGLERICLWWSGEMAPSRWEARGSANARGPADQNFTPPGAPTSVAVVPSCDA